MAVAKDMKQTTHQMDEDEELKIGFVQIGEDLLAQGCLTALDDHLKKWAQSSISLIRNF